MSVSTDGQICFGIKLEEGAALPWGTEEWDDDLERWWIEGICGYKPPFEIFTDTGYVGGKRPSDERLAEYYNHFQAFSDAHPVAVELVNYCTADDPMYILAVPATCRSNSRGYPEEFNPTDLIVTEEQLQALLDFCRQYDIEIGDQVPRWWLSSYWG